LSANISGHFFAEQQIPYDVSFQHHIIDNMQTKKKAPYGADFFIVTPVSIRLLFACLLACKNFKNPSHVA
jgi:hypothetical protein